MEKTELTKDKIKKEIFKFAYTKQMDSDSFRGPDLMAFFKERFNYNDNNIIPIHVVLQELMDDNMIKSISGREVINYGLGGTPTYWGGNLIFKLTPEGRIYAKYSQKMFGELQYFIVKNADWTVTAGLSLIGGAFLWVLSNFSTVCNVLWGVWSKIILFLNFL